MRRQRRSLSVVRFVSGDGVDIPVPEVEMLQLQVSSARRRLTGDTIPRRQLYRDASLRPPCRRCLSHALLPRTASSSDDSKKFESLVVGALPENQIRLLLDEVLRLRRERSEIVGILDELGQTKRSIVNDAMRIRCASRRSRALPRPRRRCRVARRLWLRVTAVRRTSDAERSTSRANPAR